ncbi:BZ3500_MvSof-1268-A1-R1_Chr3-1g05826 [Microbotryum saponariae]|uniref:BZ3500_MvSof-1268-A1-R1_Chr3-1g05826 protein n=1 Tax=Microbotryum saponariae TaxID=289078 RepID=A0A2X0NHE0_9BASI|nr:BZ3500_MvSof-1268-A1-R1_Chr3-1g05826 [Microbotryum saponariae]SDA05016.1 BZ3501_MvSof-1269-A2-R1_Chr3-1g05496 [Microbotryum saponariae]
MTRLDRTIVRWTTSFTLVATIASAARSGVLLNQLPSHDTNTSSKIVPDSSRASYGIVSGPASLLMPRPPECPPCNPFNCVLPAFTCLNTGVCNDYNGQCICPPGFGGEDCSKPLCGSLADGNERFPRNGTECECEPGWGGINCNVCETNRACSALIASRDPANGMLKASDKNDKGDGDGQGSDDENAVCYKQGYAVKEMFQMCDVTNRKILDMLPGRPPQVTFTCDVSSATCGFQFWIGKVESFYCGLRNCTSSLQTGYDSNYTEYSCQEMSCSCIPGRMLCGEDGSVDITEFLDEEIKGPTKFSTRSGENSKFEEPAMNQLINDIFGDSYITLRCTAGECLRASEVPGFIVPPKPNDKTYIVVTIAIAVAVLLLGLFLFWYLGRADTTSEYSLLGGRIRLPKHGGSNGTTNKSLLEDHIPAALQFSNLTYTLPNGRVVLDDISGSVKPGEIMAVMGASGAGKSTFLDLLARNSKHGTVEGDILVNGQQVGDSDYRQVVGFVDQEDTLLGTLTVYETVLYSALLRLPRDMSYEDKKMRTLETMHELGILHIRDSRIGESGHRSISGGEKRRVSIACELVTSPSILFLDECTSVVMMMHAGLDSFNAFNVIESLVQLSRVYKRTVVFTIHQPQSNIVALFDKLVLLASGKMVYSGSAKDCQAYFKDIGWACPPGFNIADYLIDLTMATEKKPSDIAPAEAQAALIQLEGEEDAVTVPDPELGVQRMTRRRRQPTDPTDAEAETPSTNGKGTSKLSMRLLSGSSSGRDTPQVELPLRLTRLVDAFAKSDIAAATRSEITAAGSAARENGHVQGQRVVLHNFKRANGWTQFKILSGRSFKNLYRNPQLMLAHYAVAVVVAGICAFLFRGLTEDIPGFQNRMGLGFFCLSLFGFSCLTTLDAFAAERLLFTRERANGYYTPAAYFTAKLLFDIVPLRVIPPFVFAAIIYSPVGLVPTVDSFWRFVMVLVAFNLSASSVVLFLSVIIKDAGVASLIGSLIMLFNLLFAGLLINRDKLPWWLQWLETTSFFHAAFEAFLVNEVRYLQLRDHRYGVDIEVPAATILSMFGFNAQAFWFPDMTFLLSVFVIFTALSFVALVVLVKERR